MRGNRRINDRFSRSAKVGVAAAAVGLALTSPGTASAETLSGWINPTPPSSSGTVHLGQSTINNAPAPVAETRIWTSFGTQAQPGTIGAQARLFKSGALCEATNYQYNTQYIPSQTVRTSGANCGTGWYNSHGFISVWDPGASAKDYVTFPTDPLYFEVAGVASARSADSAAEEVVVDSGVNAQGQSFGSAEGVDDASDIPDLVAAYAESGELGYVRRDDLDNAQAGTGLPVLATDGATEIGTFTIS
jgi:hypothetical protein